MDQICSALENGLITAKELHENVNVKLNDPIRKRTYRRCYKVCKDAPVEHLQAVKLVQYILIFK